MKTTVVAPHKSSLGMDANIAILIMFIAMAALAWIPYFGWIAAWGVPLVFLILEKQSGFVKFWAVQAIGIGIVRAALSFIFQILYWITMPKVNDLNSALNFLTGRGWGVWRLFVTLSWIIGLIITLIEVYAIWKALTYKQVSLPVIGPVAERVSGS